MVNEVEVDRKERQRESGQTIVLVALLLVALMAFVGIAVDTGFVYFRRTQLSAAVDAAALAGVVELNRDANEREQALERAAQLLHSNGIPGEVISHTFANQRYAFDADQGTSTLGARNFAITATWPVDLFFMQLIGIERTSVTASATAAHFPLADIYASRRVETGALSTSNQAVFGPHICVDYGDPFSSYGDPLAPQFRQRWLGNVRQRTYRYRILIPENYPDDVVRVELFDPDSINRPNNVSGGIEERVVHTQVGQAYGEPVEEVLQCSADEINPCLINTGEKAIADAQGLDYDQVNLWWFARIDENRGKGVKPGNPNSCGQTPFYDEGYNTITHYELYYYRETGGVVARQNIAHYYGQSGDEVLERGPGGNKWKRDLFYSNYNHQTDLRWVSPGGQQIFDQPVPVVAACGSNNGGDYLAGYCEPGTIAGHTPTPPGPGNGFEVELENDVPDIVEDASTGARYLYLDVTTLSGASENGFEVWAGPDDYVGTVSSDVNARNVQVINNPSSHSSQGVTVFGLGHLPMNSNVDYEVDIPLIYLGPEYAGTSVYVSNYDSDAGADWPLTFYFDSIAEGDWSLTFSDKNNQPDPDGVSGRCIIGDNCGTKWIDPPYEIQIPERNNDCASTGAQSDCTPFYGGRLMVRYDGGNHDTYHWNISLTGLPYLIR